MSSESTKGFTIFVTVSIAPENVDKFLDVIKPVFERITSLPECEFFEIYSTPEEPGTFSWIEDWNATREFLFEEEMSKDYFKDYVEKITPLLIKPREIKFLERVSPRFLHSRIKPTA
ncbi:hypothetical protein B0T22DRAFT_476023 [Podospora appendiculata]|uniref:ABM domain-containing protein n=1 Tax=Podospora appendiculata TaxID=314037 RepID=A0AAE0XH01_9PEZI|nr:hypothetical protein B0T22DRAFT_476023 [Podospora appendiculata]